MLAFLRRPFIINTVIMTQFFLIFSCSRDKRKSVSSFFYYFFLPVLSSAPILSQRSSCYLYAVPRLGLHKPREISRLNPAVLHLRVGIKVRGTRLEHRIDRDVQPSYRHHRGLQIGLIVQKATDGT